MNRELCGDCIYLYNSIVASRFDYCDKHNTNLGLISGCRHKTTKRPKTKIKDGFYD